MALIGSRASKNQNPWNSDDPRRLIWRERAIQNNIFQRLISPQAQDKKRITLKLRADSKPPQLPRTPYSHSDDLIRNQKIRESKLKHNPRFRDVVSCPHCGKIGQQAAMIRWHFDNCKHIKS